MDEAIDWDEKAVLRLALNLVKSNEARHLESLRADFIEKYGDRLDAYGDQFKGDKIGYLLISVRFRCNSDSWRGNDSNLPYVIPIAPARKKRAWIYDEGGFTEISMREHNRRYRLRNNFFPLPFQKLTIDLGKDLTHVRVGRWYGGGGSLTEYNILRKARRLVIKADSAVGSYCMFGCLPLLKPLKKKPLIQDEMLGEAETPSASE